MKSNSSLKNINSFAVYYGRNNVEKLSNSDLVIVEPLGQSESNIKHLKKKGSIVIGYISLLEIPKYLPEYKYLREEDFLKIDGERVVNEEFDNYLVDLRSKRWKAMVIQKIGNLILNKDYDGVFFDTIGDIEFDIIPDGIKDSLISAFVDLLLEIRELFRDCIIIQNNGIVELIKYTGALIDGVVWENPNLDAFDSVDLKSEIIEYINLLRRTYNMEVFFLFDKGHVSKNGKSYGVIDSACREGDLLIYVAGKDYLE